MATTLEGKTRYRIDTDNTGAGIAIMILTTATFAASDSTVKLIGAAVPLLALLWVRYLFQMIVLDVWQVRRGAFGLFHTGSSCRSCARSCCSRIRVHLRGLRHLPLPVTTSLAMLAPLISTPRCWPRYC